MSEATLTETEIQEPLAETPDLSEAEGQDAAGAPSPDATASPPEGTDSESDSLKLEDLEAFKQLPQTVKPEETKIPGTPLTELQEKARIGRAQTYQTILREDDAAFRDWAARQGLEPEQVSAIWNWHRNSIGSLHQGYEYWNSEFTNQELKDALPEDLREKFFSNQYGSRKQTFEAILAHGQQIADAKWQEEVKAGKYIPRDAMKTIADEAFEKGKVVGKRQAASGSSGAAFSGNGTGGRSDDELLLDPDTPINQVEAILARKMGQ